MKCSNPDCNRGIGLVAYRRSWFSKRHYCSKRCRDTYVADAPKEQQKRSAKTYFERLFSQPIEYAPLKLKPAVVRTNAHWATRKEVELSASEPGSTRPLPDCCMAKPLLPEPFSDVGGAGGAVPPAQLQFQG